MQADFEKILGQLAVRVSLIHSGNEEQQLIAWKRELDILQGAFETLGTDVLPWGVLLEMPLQRLGRRLDAVVIIGGTIAVVEFKVGSRTCSSSDVQQVEDYALCLRDFHAGSRGRNVVPIVCAEHAPPVDLPPSIHVLENVSPVLQCNAGGLANCLAMIQRFNDGAPQLDWETFDSSSYNPTPSIVDAARHVYAGHAVAEIGRADASAEVLESAANRLKEIAIQAKRKGSRRICFVSGTPGSGKTMLGLDLVFTGDAGRVAGEPAALLSGNRPLVHVLREALAEDAASRGMTKKEARRQVYQGLQNLLDYLKEHSQGEAPPEHVLVFDEAQRAWDAEVGKKLLGRERSEPALFLDILNRMPWACLVCLVGPGQEINRGEGGLALWGQALEEAAQDGNRWVVHAGYDAIHGGEYVGDGILSGMHSQRNALQLVEEPSIHLTAGLRSYRTPSHGQWVAALLGGRIEEAASIARGMDAPPAYITRDLPMLKSWLRERCRGNQRVGLLASSGAVRLIADGIPPSPRSNELDQVAHWFLKPSGDYRSSNALEVPLSEFVCQGLEIDYAGICWGGDLIWDDGWQPRAMRAPKWQMVRKDDARMYRLNTYRVLLTRARAGLGIFVPFGDDDDQTRKRRQFDLGCKTLKMAGCVSL
ncbi:DNA/RNA helicase domain-containing protein [Magnetococcus marinus]|uniref:DNA/RNA helicase domain-containing protein n=1 Tax=Magnetococcus marinus TaxID=1124597 RepID=UPI00003C5594|nr:DNA/RNA helicase domain-containing protein [Magnetococcus marinus]